MPVRLVCANCDKVFEKPRSHSAAYRGLEHDFCGRNCYDEYQRRNSIVVPCANCGKDVHLTPARQKNEVHTCSRKCKSEWMSKNLVGENNPSWKGGPIILECEVCGTEFETVQYHVDRNARFCSTKCYGEWRRESGMAAGENNPMYRDGTTSVTLLRLKDRDWKRLADNIREERGNKCQVCGTLGNGRGLPVHHIVPWSVSQDDSPENLLVVCQSCHASLDNLYYTQGVTPYFPV